MVPCIKTVTWTLHIYRLKWVACNRLPRQTNISGLRAIKNVRGYTYVCKGQQIKSKHTLAVCLLLVAQTVRSRKVDCFPHVFEQVTNNGPHIANANYGIQLTPRRLFDGE